MDPIFPLFQDKQALIIGDPNSGAPSAAVGFLPEMLNDEDRRPSHPGSPATPKPKPSTPSSPGTEPPSIGSHSTPEPRPKANAGLESSYKAHNTPPFGPTCP